MLFGVFNYDCRNFLFGKRFYYIFIFICLTLLLGFRYRVGGDSLSYEDSYGSMPTFRDLKLYGLYYNPTLLAYQPLWLYLVALAKWIGKDYYLFQLIHASIVNFLLSIYIFKNSSKPFSVILFLFITHFYFYLTIEVEREILAIGVFLLNFKNLQNKKWRNYYLLCLVSFMFHISALFLFFLPLFRNINLSRKTIVTVVIILSPIIFFKETFVEILKPLMFMEVMSSKFESYSEIEFSFLGTIYHYTGRVLMVFPLLFYNYLVSKNKNIQWLLNLYVIISVLSLALVGFERFLNYLLLPYLLIFIDYLYKMPYNLFIFKRSLLIICTVFNLCSNIPSRLLTINKYGTPYRSLFVPYVSIFDPYYVRDREDYIRELWDL